MRIVLDEWVTSHFTLWALVSRKLLEIQRHSSKHDSQNFEKNCIFSILFKRIQFGYLLNYKKLVEETKFAVSGVTQTWIFNGNHS